MTDTQDLIAQLRKDAHHHIDGQMAGLMDEAADALQSAKAEIERLKETCYQHYHTACQRRDERDAALARLAELEKQEPVAYRQWMRPNPKMPGYWMHASPEQKDRCRLQLDWEPLFAAAGASPEPSALQAENAKLITALAACRDAFPVPPQYTTLAHWYVGAMADPLEVPDYVGACVAGASSVQPSQAAFNESHFDQALQERDTYHQFADDLAAQIAAITGVDIGEHSSANNPWQEAMLAADDFIATQFKQQLAQPSQAGELKVWFGPMPESNGKSNWTAILHKGDVTDGFTIARSEYKDRVRYDADCVRHLIGELPNEPDILAYDGNLKEDCRAAINAKGGK